MCHCVNPGLTCLLFLALSCSIWKLSKRLGQIEFLKSQLESNSFRHRGKPLIHLVSDRAHKFLEQRFLPLFVFSLFTVNGACPTDERFDWGSRVDGHFVTFIKHFDWTVNALCQITSAQYVYTLVIPRKWKQCISVNTFRNSSRETAPGNCKVRCNLQNCQRERRTNILSNQSWQITRMNGVLWFEQILVLCQIALFFMWSGAQACVHFFTTTNIS